MMKDYINTNDKEGDIHNNNNNSTKLALIPRRVIFVIDRSGSMASSKWNKTIDSTIITLKQLRVSYDRYCILFFNDSIDLCSKFLLLANNENIFQSIEYLKSMQPLGSTNINDALIKAINLINNDIDLLNNHKNNYNTNNLDNFYMNQIIFITDGQPNHGISDCKQIILNVKKNNILLNDKYFKKISIFSFGIGSDRNDSKWINDLNHSFLKLLSLNNNGSYKRIKQSNANTSFNEYFSILSKPLLSNIVLKYNQSFIQYLTNTNFYSLYSVNDIIVCGKIKQKYLDDINNLKLNATISA